MSSNLEKKALDKLNPFVEIDGVAIYKDEFEVIKPILYDIVADEEKEERIPYDKEKEDTDNFWNLILHDQTYEILTERNFNIEKGHVTAIIKNKEIEPLAIKKALRHLTFLPKLKKLDLYDCRLGKIPNEVYEMSQLEKLSLGKNSIIQIEPEISKLKNLKHLSLSFNYLTSIPKAVYELPNLEFLDFYENKISVIHADIKKLKKLRVLRMDQNPLTVIPRVLTGVSSLEELRLNTSIQENNPKELDSNYQRFIESMRNRGVAVELHP